jgi:FkbM family methyltransferase
MIARIRNHILRRLAETLIESGTFRRHLGDIDANFEPRFLRAASLLRNATDAEAIFVRDIVNADNHETTLWVLHETGGKSGGYFVEFGAADGVALSNTYRLEKDYGWHGILAEPNPVWHAGLRQNRDAAIDFRCVFTTTGCSVPFAATRQALLGTIAAYTSCDGHARTRQNHELIDVETVLLDDLLEAHRAPRDIDFISIDTEGSELDILAHFDFERWNVLLFCIEHNRTSIERHLDALMGRHGYRRRYAPYPTIDAWYRKIDATSGGLP